MTQIVEGQRTDAQSRKERGRHSADREIDALPQAAEQVPVKSPSEKMGQSPRIAIGLGLLVFTAVVLAHLMWAWSVAARLVPDNSAGSTPPVITVQWFGVHFTPTLTFTLLLIVALSALAGNSAATAMVFANRAGHDQLEKYWVWWYLLRPGVSAVIAVIAYVTIKAGFLGNITETQTKGLAFAAAIGGLTGMFTDKVLDKLRAALGFSAFNKSATEDGETPPAPVPPVVGVAAPASPNGEAATTLTIPDAFEAAPAADTAIPLPPQRLAVPLEQLPVQTDNRPVPEDGPQDVDQEATPVPGSPTGYEDDSEGG